MLAQQLDNAMEVETVAAPLSRRAELACLDALDRLEDGGLYCPDDTDLTALARDLQLMWRREPRRRLVFYCDSAQGADLLRFELMQRDTLLFDSLRWQGTRQGDEYLLELQGTTLLQTMPLRQWNTLQWRDCTGHSMTLVAHEVVSAFRLRPGTTQLYGFWSRDAAFAMRLDDALKNAAPVLYGQAQRGLGTVKPSTTSDDGPPRPQPAYYAENYHYYYIYIHNLTPEEQRRDVRDANQKRAARHARQ